MSAATLAAVDWSQVAPADRLVTMPPFPLDGSVRTLGVGVVEWMMENLIQPDGPNAGKPFRPTWDQVDFLLWFYAIDDQGRWLFNLGVRRQAKGKGKPLALDTPIPTPSGWTSMGEIRPGDMVFGADGRPVQVLGVGPVLIGEPTHRVEFSDGSAIVAGAGHEWVVEDLRAKYAERTVETREIASEVVLPRRNGARRWRVRVADPLQCAEVDLGIDPWLLGFWLGDGERGTVRLTVGRDDMPAIADILDDRGIVWREQRGNGASHRLAISPGRRGGKENPVLAALRALGVCDDKAIPDIVLRASEGQRWDVLRGLVDSDGHVSQGKIEIAVVSKRLAVGTLELMRSLGLRARMAVDRARLNGRDCGPRYRVCAPVPAGRVIALLPRKQAALDAYHARHRRERPGRGVQGALSGYRHIVSADEVESVPMRCITVEGGVFLAGESMIPTHNSPFAAALALAEFLGPVRLDRFDDRVLGGAVGKPVEMPWVQIVAASEAQTKNTMRFVRAFCPKDGPLAKRYGIDVGKTQFYKLPEGTLEVITSSYTSAEGAQTTFAVGDEPEHWLPSNNGPELNSTVIDNLTKTGGRMVHTCNAWTIGAGSVAEATFDDWVAQEEGRSRADQRILYDARVAPADTDMSDRASLMAALEHVYAGSPWVDLENIIQRIWRASANPDDSIRKYLNRPVAPSNAWLESGQWGALADPSVVVAPDDEVVLFFDGSKSRDATALVACRVDDGHVFVPRQVDGSPTIWEPDPSHDTDDVVPVELVDLAVDHVFASHKVVAFFADVAEWESFVKVTWPQRYRDRLRIMAVPSGKQPEPIAWDMRSHVGEFTREAELVAQEIADGMFTHDGNPILSRHVANARRSPNRYGVSIAKESRSSSKKIDAAVAMIGARMVRRLVMAGKTAGKQPGVFYGFRR